MNGLTPPKSRAMEWSPGQTARPPREAPAPSDAFAGILDTHQARTATAEGPEKNQKAEGSPQKAERSPQPADRADAKPAQKSDSDKSDKPADAPAKDDKPTTVPAEVVAQVVTAKPDEKPAAAVKGEPGQPAAGSPQKAASAAGSAQKAESAGGTPQSAEPVVAKPQVPAQQAPVDPAKVAADAKAAETPAVPAAPVTPQTEAKPAATTAEPRVQQAPVAQPQQQQGKTGDQGKQSAQQQGQQAPLPQQAAPDQARTVAQAYGRNTPNTEVPTTVPSGTPAAAPAAPVASAPPAAARGDFAPPTPVPLARAAENVEHILRLASNRGVTHARLALTPESLGSIDVHLRHTADGVVAKVVAHSADAAQQLQQAASDLRRQLDSQGVNILSLDIGQSSPDDRSAAGTGAGFDGGGRGNSGGPAGGESAGADAETTVNSTLRLPNGVLVDVLA